MKLIDEMKDEKLGLVLLYNFTVGYGNVPLKVYDIVLPLLFNDTFSETIVGCNSIEDCFQQCEAKNSNFKNEVLSALNNYQDITQKALGTAMLQHDLSFELFDDEMCGVFQDSSIMEMNEALLLGKLLKNRDVNKMIEDLKDSEFKIVFLDSDTVGDDISFDVLRQCGNLECYHGLNHDEISNYIEDADCIITNKHYLGKDELKSCKKLKLICVTATGVNNIDLDYTHDNDITVCNVRGYSTDSVAQHTLALALSLNNKITYYNDYVKSGKYSGGNAFSHFDLTFTELSNKTWGIVGMGDIGKKVASIVSAFGCNVQYFSTSGKNNNQDYHQVDFKTLLKTSDIISIHAPLNDATNNLFEEAAFSLMKENSILINVGRGKIVNEDDLVVALNNDKIAGAALDVFSDEPLNENSTLLTIKDDSKLLLTPHVAWAAVEARNRVFKEVASNIKAYKNKEPRNVC